MPDSTENYLELLIAGNKPGLRSLFAGEPAIDDPLGGRVRGEVELMRFANERQAWLTERQARVEPLRTTQAGGRTVYETIVHLKHDGRAVPLPLAVVGDQTSGKGAGAIRVYHSLWPLMGAHRIRPPLLPLDPSLHISGTIAEYQHALKVGAVDAIVATFEPDGYFREPAGGDYVFQGAERLREFMASLLGPGGIGLEHCAIIDDGVACCIEFNAVTFGKQELSPQAGIAAYERGKSGKLHAARIYDDVNVEALAAQGGA